MALAEGSLHVLTAVTALHLPGTYKLRQIHGHWGSEPMNGSEHLVGGVGYAGEVSAGVSNG